MSMVGQVEVAQKVRKTIEGYSCGVGRRQRLLCKFFELVE